MCLYRRGREVVWWGMKQVVRGVERSGYVIEGDAKRKGEGKT